MNLDSIIRLSRRYGADSRYVLAGGGNSSIKQDNVMAVKASGVSLGTIDERGFVLLSLPKLINILEAPLSSDATDPEEIVLERLLASRLPGQTMRPSVETLLHALFPFRLVVHLHPALVNGLMCSVEALKRVPELFGEEAEVLPYTTPGYTLADRVRTLFRTRKAMGRCPIKILFLRNHGVFVAADNADEIDDLYRYIFDTLGKWVRPLPLDDDSHSVVSKVKNGLLSEDIRVMIEAISSEFNVRFSFTLNSLLGYFLGSPEAFEPLSQPFTPDHIVYAGAWPLFLSQSAASDLKQIKSAIHEYIANHGELPKILAIQRTGIFGLGKDDNAAERACLLFQDAAKIAWYAQSFGGVHPMESEDADFIRGWEVEKFRSGVAANGLTSPSSESAPILKK
jgi:rhamnose utilization protein RhaD (predicted bifunctional aldolase and dehydrogenase)